MADKTIIRVCMGPAGIAAGGKLVLEAFTSALTRAGVQASVRENCASHQVGCLGLCARDVLVEVHENDSKTVYQYIKPDMVERIVDEHVVQGTPVQEWLVDEAYEKFYAKQKKIVLADRVPRGGWV
jgi:NADH-quinone oxidoreductase subunit F